MLDATAFEGATTPDEIVRRDPDPDDLAPFLRQIHDDFDAIEPRLRAQLTSRLGQEVRGRRRARQLETVVDMFERHGLDPEHQRTQQLARVVAMLASSPIYLDQIDRPRDEVLDDIAWAVRALTASVRGPDRDPVGRPAPSDDTDEETSS